MNEEYLWNRSGEPDPEVARLENLLAPLAYRASAPVPIQRRTSVWKARFLSAAAAVAVVAGLSVWFARRAGPVHSGTPAWQIAASEGTPRVSGKPLAASTGIYAGQVIETGAHSSATLQSESVGRLVLEPQSRLSVEAATPERQLLSLQLGTIHALIWAPPARFVVDTPSARATDLGCAYTLHVDSDGGGLVTVQTGWVAFGWKGIESFIPAGAACSTSPKRGPGVPYFLDATPEFRTALAGLRHGGSLDIVLAQARKRDALTLWHLLKRVPPDQRGRVFDRFALLVPLPPDVRRDGILAGNAGMLDRAWDALDLGDTTWWRHWRQDW